MQACACVCVSVRVQKITPKDVTNFDFLHVKLEMHDQLDYSQNSFTSESSTCQSTYQFSSCIQLDTLNNHVLHSSRFYVLFVSSRTPPVLLLLFVYIDDQNAKIYRENKNAIVLSLVSLSVPNPNKTPLGSLELEARECRSIHLDMQLIRSRQAYIFRCKINAHEG